MTPTETAETRRRVVRQILGRAYMAMSRELPDSRERELIVSAWLEVLDAAKVPTTALDECYALAMGEHEGFGMMGANQVVRKYRERQAQRANCPPVYIPPPELERKPSEEEIAEIRATMDRLREERRQKVLGFRAAADVATPTPAAEEWPVRCVRCGIDYPKASNQKGCPRCRAWDLVNAATDPRTAVLESTEWHVDDALESGAVRGDA